MALRKSDLCVQGHNPSGYHGAVTDVSLTRATRINVADHGARPGTGQDTVIAVRRALGAAAAASGPVVLEFPPGEYHFYADHSTHRRFHVTNTASEAECPDASKTIAILVEQLTDLTIEGNGADFIFHGRQTMLVLDHCRDVRVRNITFDFAHPTIAEMTVTGSGPGWIEVQVHPATRYELVDGTVHWVGPGWAFADGPAQVYDPTTDRAWRLRNPLAGADAEEHAPGRLRFRVSAAPEVAVGHVLQLRDGLRDQVGILVAECQNVSFENVTIHYAHGLGVVAQSCQNLTLERLRVEPRAGSGRTAAAFADMVHVSGCRGTVRIADSRLVGAHDDAVNVHGTHLGIVAQPAPSRIVVRFLHPQTYGITAFRAGDEIAVVDASTLCDRSRHRVISVEPRSPRETELTLDSAVTAVDFGDVVENLTCCPEVEVARTHFSRIPTRGVLATTRRPVRIEDNVFHGLGLSGILIADDAASWFESGPVRDVTIRGNRFVDCGGPDDPVIWLAPENPVLDVDRPVHRNVTIRENTILTTDAAAVAAKSTRGIVVTDNLIVRASATCGATEDGLFEFTACSDIELARNEIRAAEAR